MELVAPVILFLGIPFLMLFLFKSNAGIMFLAACAGLVLLNNLDPVVVTTAGSVVPGEGEAYVRLAVVMLSIVFSGMIFKVSSKGITAVLNIIIAVLLALMLWLTLPTASGVSWLVNSMSSDYWQDLNDFKSLIIAAGFALSLVVILMGSKKSSHGSKHGKGKH